MDNDLIVIRQLPVIEEQLKSIKAAVESRVQSVLSMECTEETRKEVKAARAELNKEFEELERRRKEVKKAIMEPYENFERMYNECAGSIYKDADRKLREKISMVETGIVRRKAEEIIQYFYEYSESLGLDNFVSCSESGIHVTISATTKSLKENVRSFLDRVSSDLKAIDTMEHCDEIRAEYRKTLDLSTAISTVEGRMKAIEEERNRKKPDTADVEKKVFEILVPPTVKEKTYSTVFKVTGTIEQLRELKKFMNERGINYEQPGETET